MAFLNNLGKKIGDAAEAASDKAKELAEITKLNSSISSEQKKIEALYAEIGKIIFESEKGNPESAVAGQCDAIIAGQNTIEELTEKVNSIKGGGQASAGTGKKFCGNCGAEISETMKFCGSCGSPV